MVNIFEYQNYRLYLRDYYEEQKATKRYFSYRYFSKKAGINASAFLYYIIEGKRNLTKNSILKISQAIGHSRDEASYFENLAFFNQADTIAEKSKYYSELVEGRRPIDIRIVSKERYEYYRTWYHSVVREVVTLIDFKDDYKKLALYIVPSITEHQAAESVKLLEKLGFIERDDNGLYHQTDNLVMAKPDVIDAIVIEKFQMEMLHMALKAYDVWPQQDRMSSSTTLSISRATFDLFKKKFREFRQELMEMARLDTSMDQAFQLTINLFPVSKKAYE